MVDQFTFHRVPAAKGSVDVDVGMLQECRHTAKVPHDYRCERVDTKQGR